MNPKPLTRYESPSGPDVGVMSGCAMEAFPVAIVGFAVAYSVAKVYAVKHDYTIDGNQVSGRAGRTGSVSEQTGRGPGQLVSRQEGDPVS